MLACLIIVYVLIAVGMSKKSDRFRITVAPASHLDELGLVEVVEVWMLQSHAA